MVTKVVREKKEQKKEDRNIAPPPNPNIPNAGGSTPSNSRGKDKGVSVGGKLGHQPKMRQAGNHSSAKEEGKHLSHSSNTGKGNSRKIEFDVTMGEVTAQPENAATTMIITPSGDSGSKETAMAVDA
ncbi:unnamed protein product [Linum trigynum]